MNQENLITIQLLSVADCPLVAKAHSILDDCLKRIPEGVRITVEELVGDYSSPTILVNGIDVTGQCPAAGSTSCRLGLPNEEQILAMIRKASRSEI